MDNLPVPKTRIGWMFSLLLMLIAFGLYYLVGFNFLMKKYTESFWSTGTYPTNGGASLKVEARVPFYLSSFVARELTIRIDNRTTGAKTVKMVISAIKCQKNDCDPVMVESETAMKCTGDADLAPVLICEKVDEKFVGCGDGNNILDFGSIPVDGQVIKTFWVVAQPEKLEGYQQKTDQVKFVFKQQADGKDSCLNLNKLVASNIDIPEVTLAQSFLRSLLLPPWSNGLIPALALFIVAMAEGKIQPVPDRGGWFLKRFGSLLLLYIAVAVMISSAPLIISDYSHAKFISENASAKLAADWYRAFSIEFVWFIVGFLLLLIGKIIIGKNSPSDLSGNDPLYQISKEAPQVPPSSSGEIEIRDALTQINASLKELADFPSKFGMVFTQSRLEEIQVRLDNLTENNTAVVNAKEFQDIMNEIQVLSELNKSGVETVKSLFQKQIANNLPEEGGFDLKYLVDKIYLPNMQTVLSDDGAVALLKSALTNTSQEQINSLLGINIDFALSMLSLLVVRNDKSDDLKVGDAKFMDIMLAYADASEKPNAEDKTVLKKWLDEVDTKYIPQLMDILLTKKRNLAEKYLFEIDLKKCDVLHVIPLLAKYITQKQEKGESTDIRWRELVFYLISIGKKDVPDRFTGEQVFALNTVLYPVEGRSILLYANEISPLSLDEFEIFYSVLLNMLCALPADLFERVANEIYVYYENKKELPKSELFRFMQAYRDHENDLPNLQADWCKGSSS